MAAFPLKISMENIIMEKPTRFEEFTEKDKRPPSPANQNAIFRPAGKAKGMKTRRIMIHIMYIHRSLDF